MCAIWCQIKTYRDCRRHHLAQADKILTLVKAANVEVEAYFPGLFAKLFERRSVDDLISSVGSGEGFTNLLWCVESVGSCLVKNRLAKVVLTSSGQLS